MTSQAYTKEYSQSSSQVNTCGNGFLASEVLCSNKQYEIQGDENIVFGFAAQTSEVSGIASHDTKMIGDEPKSDSTGQKELTSDSTGQQELTSDSTGQQELTSDSTGQQEVKLSNNINDNTNAEEEIPPSSTVEDPTLLALPCCDEMPDNTLRS